MEDARIWATEINELPCIERGKTSEGVGLMSLLDM